MKIIAFVLCFLVFALEVQAAELKCTYEHPEKQLPGGGSQKVVTTIQVNANTTVVFVNSGNDSYGLAHTKDFDVVLYAERTAKEKGFSKGYFYGVRRDDGEKVILRATIGQIIDGVAADIEEDSWDFGSADDSLVIVDPQNLGSLTCGWSVE